MQVAGYNVNKKKVVLYPFNYYQVVQRWEQANLYPLNGLLNVFQVVRFMLLTGHYALSYKWATASAAFGIPYSTVAAMRNIEFLYRRKQNIDFFKVVEVMTAGKWGPDTAAGADLPLRNTAFDTMSAKDAVSCARQLLQAMNQNVDVHDLPVSVEDLPDIEPVPVQFVQVQYSEDELADIEANMALGAEDENEDNDNNSVAEADL